MTTGKQNLKTRVYGQQTKNKEQNMSFHPEIFCGSVQ